jgi:hypothetical protein
MLSNGLNKAVEVVKLPKRWVNWEKYLAKSLVVGWKSSVDAESRQLPPSKGFDGGE